VKFDLSDFLELDTKALLAVNGGASCSGGSCSSSVSKNTGSCGSSGSSYSGSCSSTGGSSYGGSCGTSGGNCGSFGGSCSSYGGSNVETSNGGGGNNDQPKETTPSYNIVGNSYAEVANAKPGDKMKKSEDEYIILTQGDIDWAKAQLEKNATNSESTKTDTELNEIIGVGSCGGTCGGVGTGDTGDMGNNGEVEGANGSGAGENGGSGGGDGGGSDNSNKPAEEKISASIQENNDKQYNYDTGYRCDNWVEEVLNDAGYDASDYLTAGNSYEKTVQQHIDALTSSKTEGVDYTKTLPTADGAYVVFMDDSSIGYAEHAAILVIENGVATLYDNSSGRGNAFYKEDEAGNVLKDKDGNPRVSYYDQGVASEKVYGANNGSKIDGYGYDTFYYQKIN